MEQPVLRFAPSPNGELHLGHAYSALFGAREAARLKGRYLLRIEDIDTLRCRPEHVEAAMEILGWLGLRFDGPVRRQSEHMDDYARALAELEKRGLLFPCWCTRTTIAAHGSDPDGAPRHSGRCAHGQGPFALRLDMEKAAREVSFFEKGEKVQADPSVWGDVILARKDIGTSYHLSVVVDDGLQKVSHVTRGQDLQAATSLHRLLQHWLELPAPEYHHHDLIRDGAGRKLSKSEGDKSLASLRAEGVSAQEIHAALGF